MLDPERLLKNATPRDLGVFMPEKCIFIVEGSSVGVGQSERCDNISFSGVSPTDGTPYESHAQSLYAPTIVSDAIIDITQITIFRLFIFIFPLLVILPLTLFLFFDFCSKGFGLADDGFDGLAEAWRPFQSLSPRGCWKRQAGR